MKYSIYETIQRNGGFGLEANTGNVVFECNSLRDANEFVNGYDKLKGVTAENAKINQDYHVVEIWQNDLLKESDTIPEPDEDGYYKYADLYRSIIVTDFRNTAVLTTSVTQAAERLSLSRNRIYQLITEGRIKLHMVGPRWSLLISTKKAASRLVGQKVPSKLKRSDPLFFTTNLCHRLRCDRPTHLRLLSLQEYYH